MIVIMMMMMMIMSRVDGSYLCPKCELPLCGEQCSAGPWHRPECSVFSRSVFTIVARLVCCPLLFTTLGF